MKRLKQNQSACAWAYRKCDFNEIAIISILYINNWMGKAT